MKRKITFLLITLLVLSFSVKAQTSFGSPQIITTTASTAMSVYACDIDGDGDNDVLSASQYDDKIAWYENTDENGTFGSQQIITTQANGANSVYACDIDG
ncbi:MAG: VCBS repeat-containing protein, partial [Bacteroidales bacterium]|nr:VCBS repeat-containing protein [Bacteroidales bacterium]